MKIRSYASLLHQQPTDAVLLKPRTHQNGKFGGLSACIIVQAHHAEHLLALLVDGNEGHGTSRIVMDELIEQLVARLAHWSEEAQPKILGCYVT